MGDESQPFDPPPAQDPADLLQRAMGMSPVSAVDDEPALWHDPASLRELRVLTRLGIVAAVTAALAIAYLLSGGFDEHPSLAFVMVFVDGAMAFSLVVLFVFGVVATVRRRLFGWLLLGIIFSPLVYSVWAAVTLRRLRPAEG